MRKPALSSWKRLNERMDRVAAQVAEPRICGLVVRSPRLCDGTVEVYVNNHRFALLSEQIGQISERFPDTIGGGVNALAVTEGRTPMNNEDFAEYFAFLERRNHP